MQNESQFLIECCLITVCCLFIFLWQRWSQLLIQAKSNFVAYLELNRIRLFNISCLFEPVQLQIFRIVFDSTSNLWQKEKIFHVQLENSGNGPDFSGVHELSFGEALYFLMVTMSTVGYGDIVCQTKVGRVFQLLFLGVGLVSFVLLVLSLDCFFLSTNHQNY